MRDVTPQTLCPDCHQPALARCTTDAARREVSNTGICGICWDNLFDENPDDEDEEDYE